MALLFAAMACLTAGATRPLLLVQRTSVTRQLVRARRPRAPTTVFARMASTACGSVVEKGGVCNDEGGAGAPPALAGPPVTVGKAVSTGRLRQAPNLPQITRIVKMARKEMYLDGKEAEKTLKEKSLNAKQRCCRLAARKLDVLTKHLVVPLRDYQRELKAFLRDLHPFERELVRLTLAARERMGGPSFVSVLEAADTLRKEITAAGKAACAQCPDLNGAAAATAFEAAQYDLLVEMLEAGEQVFQDLDDVGKLVRSLPSCSSSEPLAVLVGLPNVGKSSLVGALSSATPEVNAYPFTTKRLTLGHVDASMGRRLQVMDTPGILAREPIKRNAIEQLTFCALRELKPTAILYVLDPTGLGGKMSAAEEQLEVRRELREAFPEPLWIDVLSKSDVLEVAQRGGDVGALALDSGAGASEDGWAGWDGELGKGVEEGKGVGGAEGDVVLAVAGDNAAADAVLQSAAAIDACLAVEAAAGGASAAFRVSVRTGEGVDALRALLEELVDYEQADGAPALSMAARAAVRAGGGAEQPAGADGLRPMEALGRRAVERWASEPRAP